MFDHENLKQYLLFNIFYLFIFKSTISPQASTSSYIFHIEVAPEAKITQVLSCFSSRCASLYDKFFFFFNLNLN